MIKNRDNERLPQSYCDFKAPGGTIGRGTDNTLILPDKTRAISRLQAIVHISPTGEPSVTHRGSTTPLLLNGNELPHSVQNPLVEGDILDIGGYRFSVSLQEASAIPAPMLEPDIAASSAYGIHETIWDELEAEFRWVPPHRNASKRDDPDHPLLANGPDRHTTKDPLAMPQETELASLQTVTTDPDRLFTQDEPFSQPTIMKDTTPSVLFIHPELATKSDKQTTEHPPLTTATEKSAILFGHEEDELFTTWAPNTDAVSEDDPISLFISNAVPLTTATDDLATLVNELPSWLCEPEPQKAVSLPAEKLTEQTPPPSPQEVTRWQEQLNAPEISSCFDNALFQPVPPEHSAEHADEIVPPRSRMGIEPVRHQSFKPLKSTSKEQLHGELFSAFVNGLGLDDAPVAPDFSPEQLYLAGRLLSLFSQGTVALLSSRNILKRGLKAEMTMILEEENNPFKMLPSGKTVLMQIFSTPMPGFTPPENAVRDAMLDLQAHQLGMIAGVRAIIAAMLQTFHPDTLEKKALESGNAISKGLFGMNRKAILWEMLKRQYQQVANEVDDDFHTLFGEAFLHAYDLEISQYKASQNRKGS
ncbi:type VI secretion system-associated FHA domain protein TagH [Serratia sp. DD3]|uniref:type VI secretion system-associated FHA domain protein TagH n=1 Tax=Serratia sp. DD3 TaxID=1410619 RepID=UPI001F407252|nr:type VI secretion system-associated FHA domain protein TagH [Serratia sp. DD3]